MPQPREKTDSAALRLFRFAEDVEFHRTGEGCATVSLPAGRYEMTDVPGELLATLDMLPAPSWSVVRAAKRGGEPAVAEMDRLAGYGAFEDVLIASDGVQTAVARRPSFPFANVDWIMPKRLRQHCFIKLDSCGWVLMNPATRTWVSAELDCLVSAVRAFTVHGGTTEPSELGQLLADHGFLADVEAANDSWEFHDALFHGVSSLGRATTGQYGGTYKGSNSGAAPLPPWLRDVRGARGAFVEIPAPLPENSPPLFDVLAGRRTARDFAATGPSLGDMGRLFASALRTTRVIRSADDYYALHRYPSGGARDEISTLLASRETEGSDARLFSYVNHEHAFFHLEANHDEAETALRVLNAAAGVRGAQAGSVMLFVSHYERMAWKYEGVAYATILRNVGAIYQTVSLAAHALGLASCALGGGWGALEEGVFAPILQGRVIVGAMLIGTPFGAGS